MLEVLYPVLESLVRELSDRGTLVVGTDSSWNLPFMIPGVAMHWEMTALVEAGLTQADVVRAATIDAAHLLGEERLGRIEEGYLADLLLLEENPLTDIANLNRIAGVMRDGVWFSASQLDAELRRLVEKRR